jgi:hypothetical protein
MSVLPSEIVEKQRNFPRCETGQRDAFIGFALHKLNVNGKNPSGDERSATLRHTVSG